MTRHKALFLAFLWLLTSGCGSAPPKTPAAALKATWFPLIVDDTSDWQVRFRPKDMVGDPVFGPLLRRVEREASAAVGDAHIGQTTLQALEQSDVIVLAVRTAHPLDAVMVISGVPASASPDKLVDDDGAPLWRHVEGRGHSVEEYVRVRVAHPGDPAVRLVALSGRTWIVAVGGAVDRTATALSTVPPNPYRPDAPARGQDLADVLLVGELLVPLKSAHHAELLQPLVAPLVKASLRLDGGRTPAGHLVLTYRDGPSAVAAEDFVRALQAVFAERYPVLKGILESALITRLNRDVRVDSAVPGGVVRMLLGADHVEQAPDQPPGPDDPDQDNHDKLRPKPETL